MKGRVQQNTERKAEDGMEGNCMEEEIKEQKEEEENERKAIGEKQDKMKLRNMWCKKI